MMTMSPVLLPLPGFSLLIGTAFVLALITLMSAPFLLDHLWRAIKCAAVVSVTLRTVTEVWPWIPDHPWVVSGAGLGQALAVWLHDAARTAAGHGFQTLLPLLLS
jgi:hypothetical protein